MRVRDVELGEHVTRGKGHLVQIGDIPRTEDDAAIEGILLQLADDFPDLIDALARVVGVAVDVLGAEVAPLETVDGAEVALLSGREAKFVEVFARAVTVPDMDPCFRQWHGRGAAGNEPEEFRGDGAEEDAFGGQKWENSDVGGRVVWVGPREGEAQLWRGEDGEGSGAGAVRAMFALRDDTTDEIQVLKFFVVGFGLGLGFGRGGQGDVHPCGRL